MDKLCLRAIKAKHGDSLLLLSSGVKVLVDGGPSGVYNQTLRDQLRELDRDGEDQPRIDLLMVSHIDADHIDGILDLTAEIIEAREDEREPIVRVDRAWHNSFSDMIAKSGTETSSQVKASAASVASAFSDMTGVDFDPHESKLVLSSVSQGRQLRLDLKALNVDLNKRFNERVVLQSNATSAWQIGGMKISVIGPTQKELDKLQILWEKELKKILDNEGEASTASAGELDTSISNLASIVVIVEVDGTKALLTGDARGDMILDWLEQTGWLKENETVHFDIVKLPHHGSDRNVSEEFFKRVTADHYLMSGNGGHGNPEPRTFELLFDARPELNYKVHMTYSPDELKAHKKFKKVGNVEKLDAVLSSEEREKVLYYPIEGKTYIDIVPD